MLSTSADQVSHLPARKLVNRLDLLFLWASAVFLYFSLFVPPGTPIFRHGDQGVYLNNAARMLGGQSIYRDFFQFTAPGTESVFLVLFKFFGLRTWIPNLVLMVLGLALVSISIIISSNMLTGWVVYLPGLLFLTFAFRSGLDASHHWFSSLGVMAALAMLVTKRTAWRIAGAGALCGLASDFTQMRGLMVVSGLGLYLAWERRRQAQTWRELLRGESCLLGGYLATLITFNAYFAREAGARKFFYCTVVFGYKYFSAPQGANSWRAYLSDLPRFVGWHQLPGLAVFLFIHVLLPLVYILFFVRYRREAGVGRREAWDRAMLLNVGGLFMLLGVAPAPSWFRLCTVSLPAMIILVFLLSSGTGTDRVVLRLLFTLTIILTIAEPLQVQFRWKRLLDLPSGRTAFTDPLVYSKVKWLSEHTRESEYVFGATNEGISLRSRIRPLCRLSPTPTIRGQSKFAR